MNLNMDFMFIFLSYSKVIITIVIKMITLIKRTALFCDNSYSTTKDLLLLNKLF